MSKKGKAVAGATVAAALAVSMGAGAAIAADTSYAPTTLGNSAYTNQVDARNDYTVQAMRYTSSISHQNDIDFQLRPALVPTSPFSAFSLQGFPSARWGGFPTSGKNRLPG